jgi:hypothetical protein
MSIKRAFPNAKSGNVLGQARKPSKMFCAGLYARVSANDQTAGADRYRISKETVSGISRDSLNREGRHE